MMMPKTYTCIVCPVSCRVTVEEEAGGLKFTGHLCKRGEEFAANEHTDPKRMITSTVAIRGALLPRLPVVGDGEVPKTKLMECLRALYALEVTAPVRCGDVIAVDICGTGVNILASRSMAAQ